MFANFLYCLALALVSPFVLYRMIRHGRYRRGIRQKLLGLSKRRAIEMRRGRDCWWIHAVSVGEVNLLPRLVTTLEQENPSIQIVISTSTDTGFDLANKRFGSDRVFFCPLDFSWAVKRTLRNLQPRKLVLAELELWPNLIRNASHSGIPVAVINGRLSERSARQYKRFAWLVESTFHAISWVGCQDERTRQNFQDCGVPSHHLEVTGSLKFDDAPESRDNLEVQSRSQWACVDPWHHVWIVGSTSGEEEDMALQVYQQLVADHRDLRLVVVPRHPERFDRVAKLIEQSGFVVHRRSNDLPMPKNQWAPDHVILVDTIGELCHWWGVGRIATVGGSFGDRGGQNMLEPAGYGSAISFGPDTRNFRDIATLLLNQQAAVRVRDEAELRSFVCRCLTDIPAADSLGVAAKEVVAQHRGATNRTVAALLENSDAATRRTRNAA